MSDGPAPLLSVRNLSTQVATPAGARLVVEDLSFDLNPGETLCIAGESGSGKSMTSLSIMGLLPQPMARVARGQVLLEGRDLLALPERQMRRVRGGAVAMIFQEPMTSLNPVMSVGRQIGEAVRAHRRVADNKWGAGEARRLVLEALEAVRISEPERRLAQYPHELSGGMRQRVMIAMALACRPKVLIADEPTTALDVTIQAQILELMRDLQRQFGTAIMLITHDMGVVAEVADRVVVMYQGRKVEEGPTEQIFTAPQHPYTKALLSAVPKLGSLKGQALPARFPLVRVDGAAEAPPQPQDTVRAEAAPLLQVDGLSTRFDVRRGVFGRLVARVHAVEQVSFGLQPGETLALVGESGCGKSTTGRTIMQLLEPSAGSIRFEGRAMAEMKAEERRRLRQKIQYVFQDPFASLNPRLTVGFSIAEPLLTHGLAKGRAVEQRVADLLSQVGLRPEHAKRYPHEFSGGQRQRICIARALASEPKLIIADEAVAALDVSIQAQVVNLLMELQARHGLSYLFISHDMAVVERVSHRVAVMYLGQIVEIGPRQAVFENPQHPYTRRLMAAVPVADPSRRNRDTALIEGEIPSPIRTLGDDPLVRPLETVGPGHFVARHRVGDFG